MIKNYNWECECGYTEPGDKPPKECPECFNINSFESSNLPEEDDED
jgi:rubrerythrin